MAGAALLPYAGSAYNWGKKKLTNEEVVDYDEAPEGVDSPEPESVAQRYKNWTSSGAGKQDQDDYINRTTSKATEKYYKQQQDNAAAADAFMKKPRVGSREEQNAQEYKIRNGGRSVHDDANDSMQEGMNYAYGRPAREGRDDTIASKINALRDSAANKHYAQYAHGQKDPEDYEADVEQYGGSTIKNLPVKGILR